MVQFLAVPKPDAVLSAVVVSGGKQYRVAPGDQILVDRLAAEPGTSVTLGRVLLFNDGSEIKVGSPAVDGLDVEARVLAHRRGPRVESIRYKSKKRVRVHHGGRADLTALEILTVGGIGAPAEEKATATPGAKPAAKSKGRARAAETKKKEINAEAAAPAATTAEEKPKRATRRAKKETE